MPTDARQWYAREPRFDGHQHGTGRHHCHTRQSSPSIRHRKPSLRQLLFGREEANLFFNVVAKR